MKIYNAIIQLYCQCFNKPVNGYSSVCTRNHISLQNVLLAYCCCVVQKASLIPIWQKTIFANYITPESQIKKIVLMAS